MSGGGPSRRRWPVSLGLAASLIVVFATEHLFALDPGGPLLAPGLKTLLALGAANARLVIEDGQWYRLVAAPLLHGDALHLGVNAVTLLAAGTLLERRIGRARLLILTALGAVAGSVAGLILNPPQAVSVGASGAVMALLAAVVVLADQRLPPGAARRWRIAAAILLAPALWPLGALSEGTHVDYASHLGGTLAGIVGALAMRHMRADRPAAVQLAAIVAVMVFVGAGMLVARDHQHFRLAVQLIPNDGLPKTDHEAITLADQLVARYPRDPRARLMQARAHLIRDDLEAAEATLRAGLAEDEILRTMFTRETEWKLRAMLAGVLAERGQRPQARHLVRDICLNSADNPLRLLLDTQGLCREPSLQ